MYWATFSNVLKCASGNVLKIVADKNDVKFPLKYRNMYGNPWLPVITGGNAFYKSTRDTKKPNRQL